MGCDIHSYVETKSLDGDWINQEHLEDIFGNRNYGVFAFLAGVRNYSRVPTIAERRGLPEGLSQTVSDEYEGWSADAHSASWLSAAELLSFDYDQSIENRRGVVQVAPNAWDHGATLEPGDGKQTTYREFLGGEFFSELERLRSVGTPDRTRVVFWFDN